jgi:hypothetical protein
MVGQSVRPSDPEGDGLSAITVAETSVATNNKSVTFRGKAENEMPVVSKAQNAAMHAAEQGKSTLGIPKKVGAEFVKGQTKGLVKKLPTHVKSRAKSAMKRGMISEKAAKRHLGEY